MHSTLEKSLLWVVKIGLWFLPILPLYIAGGMLFPFITGKNFIFRIVVEFIFVFWAALAVLNAEYRPKLTLLFKAATIFIVILFLADLFSPNPLRSFFSNYERMEGFMMLSHLYLYFVMLSSTFKKKDWTIFLHVSLATSLVVSFLALLQKFGFRVSVQGGFRVDSTIGNPAYLASYLLFHIWLLLLFLRRYWERLGLRIFYALAGIFELVIIYYTATRGAMLALLLGALVLTVISVLFWNRAFPAAVSYRKFAYGVLGVLILIPAVFWTIKDTDFIRKSAVLPRFASISFNDRTTQSRFAIWKMSAKAALERPILGWGQENYYLVFQKYFDPKLHSSEPWFDRSHNIIFDWLVHAGVLGLLSYLSVIAAALWGIWRALRGGGISFFEGLVLGIIFLAHFFENLFVFDNLNTYLLFFGFLAYSQFATASEGDAPQRGKNSYPSASVQTAAFSVLGAGVALFFVAGYFLHWKPMRESNELIKALVMQSAKAPLGDIQKQFQRALSYNTFGDSEVREQMGNMARDIITNQRYTAEERAQFIPFAIEEMKKEVARPHKDIKHLIFTASVLGRAGSINPAYIGEAEALLGEAIRLSPTKQILYFELAQLYLAHGKVNEALNLLKKSVYLEPTYQQAVVNTLIVAHLAQRQDAIAEVTPFLRLSVVDEDALRRLGTIYQEVGNFSAAKEVFAILVTRDPNNAHYHATAAALFAQQGELDRAIAEAEAAARLDPQFVGESKLFIEQIKKQRGQ